jgi:proline dehydrogenase
MLGPALLRASRSDRLRRAVETGRLSRRVVTRFVAGEDIPSAGAAAAAVHQQGMMTSLDVLGEDVRDLASVRRTRDTYLALLRHLQETGQAARSEVSLKLSAVGQGFPDDGHAIAHEHAYEISAAANAVGCRLTLDMEDHTTVDSTLAIGMALRTEFPLTGNVLQANLKRTASDIEALARSGARIRIVKGAYREPRSVAFQRKSEVDRSYRIAIRMLMESTCYPMVATHDPLMLRETRDLALRNNRSSADWEAQMLYGIGKQAQHVLVKAGLQVRVYIPFGTDWYGYFMRRLAERPANVTFFLRSLVKG